MIPTKSKALLVAVRCRDSRSLAFMWAELGIAALFLACAILVAT